MARSKKSLRQQYIQESKYIRRRLSDIEKRMPDSMIVQRYKNEFPGVSVLGPTSDEGFRLALDEMRKLRRSGQLSLSAERRSKYGAINTLNERGYNFVNEQNFKPLFDFLDDARARGLTSIYGYTTLLTAFDKAIKRGLSESEILGNIDYYTRQMEIGRQREEKARKRGEDYTFIPGKFKVRKGRKPSSNVDIDKRLRRKPKK